MGEDRGASRIAEARGVARLLLDNLEGAVEDIDAILMRTKRLARLIRDGDAQKWIDFEIRGYPDSFEFSALGSCLKYAISCGRVIEDGAKYYKTSLPAIEADVLSKRAMLDSKEQSKDAMTIAKDFVEFNATKALMAVKHNNQELQAQRYGESKSKFSSFKSGIHSYVSDVYLSLEFGDIAQDIFESARREIDNFVRSYCPDAAEKLIAINDRMADDSIESRTAALTSCRRLLMVVADAIYPPSNEDWKAPNGQTRKVGQEHYKNRLLAYIVTHGLADGNSTILDGEINFIAAKLDAIYDKTCKGVHADVSAQETRLAVIHTYLFLGEIAKLPIR